MANHVTDRAFFDDPRKQLIKFRILATSKDTVKQS